MQVEKLWLKVNGVERMMIVDMEKDTLATVVRRLGCTSVKVGCGIGVCGTCTVLLNGKLVRACTRKISKIEEYSEVITVEGIGTPQHLHPIQQAWIYHGAIQCGFCTPAFIVSTYALLKENINPTREEVRDWFEKNRNVCRCTGYQQLVDAVMDAAAVMRGEKTFDDITYQNADGEYYGTAVPRPDALAKVCGLCDYGDDISEKLPAGAIHLALVQPKKAFHAKILNIDYSKALAMPGVIKIIDAKDVKGTNNLSGPSHHPRSKQEQLVEPIFCTDTIYRYGDVVAVVAADTREHARAAAAAVEVELEQLPEYHNYVEAAAPGAMSIQFDAPNVYAEQPIFKGDYDEIDDIIENSAYSVQGSFYSSREPHLSLEGCVMQSYIEADGTITIQGKPQAIGEIRQKMADGIGVPVDKIRVILNPAGGTFGWGMAPDQFAIMAVCTMALDGALCSLQMSYEEHQHYSGKRCPSNSNGIMACDENGKITALKYDAGIDTGPYPEFAEGILAQRLPMMMGFGYNIPTIEGISRGCLTNHALVTTYRGYGSPQAYTCGEALVDMLARKAGIDPLEFRQINVAHEGDLTPFMAPYREPSQAELLDMMKPHYEEAKKRAAELDTPEVRRGVGVCLGGYTCTAGSVDAAGGRLELLPDGSVAIFNTWEEMGQGGNIGNVMGVLEALKPLGLTPEQVHVRTNDSKTCPDSGPAAGSRSHVMNTHATVVAANKMLAAMKKDDGTYRTYDEMVAEGLPTEFEGQWLGASIEGLSPIDPNIGKGDPIPIFMYACFMAEVAVEVATGKVTTTGFHACVDIGKPGNIDAVLGQGYGGISHGIGFALSEQYDDVKKHANMLGAGIPSIKMIPDNMQIEFLDSKRSHVEFNSTGCSEMFQSSPHVAVLNAIQDACGVRVWEIPATKDKVLAGLKEIEEFGEQKTPEPYYMGSDFDDEVEYIKDNPVEMGSGPKGVF